MAGKGKKKEEKQTNSMLKYVSVKKTHDQLEKNKNVFDFVKNKLSTEILKSHQIPSTPDSENSNDSSDLTNLLNDEKNKNIQLTNDLIKSVTLLKNASALNLQKDIQIKELNHKLNNDDCQQEIFLDFANAFKKEQLAKLRSIPAGKSRDSTFVLTCMRFMYPDPTVLSNRSVLGRRYKTKHQQLTPSKLQIIREILSQRISSERGIDALCVTERLKKVNKMITDAISKIKPKTRKELNSVCAEGFEPSSPGNLPINVQNRTITSNQLQSSEYGRYF